MKNIIEEDYKKYFLIGILIISLFLGFLIIKPFIIPILTAIFLAYAFQPLSKKINEKIKKDWASSLIICLMIILVIIIPLILTIQALTTQSISVYSETQNYLNSQDTGLKDLNTAINDKSGINLDLQSIILTSVNFFIEKTKYVISSLPNLFLKFFVMLFLLYYLLKDWDKLVLKTRKYIPLKKDNKDKIINEIDNVTKAVIYGTLMTAVIQGILATIAYFVVGINSPLFWGSITIIAALIPFGGTAIIWLPASIILIMKGIFLHTPSLIVKGIGLLIYGILLVSTIDNFIKPKLIGNKVHMHPALVLLGVIGGISVFGFIGIIFGPLIFGLITTIFEVYSEHDGI